MKKIFSFLLIIIILFSATACAKKDEEVEVPDKLVSYTIPDNFKELYKDYLFYYMPKEDLSGKHGSIAITAYESDKEYSKEFLNEIKAEHAGYKNGIIKHYKTPKYDGVEVVFPDEEFDLIRYIIPSGYITVEIVAFDYHNYPTFRTDLKSIIDSLDI